MGACQACMKAQSSPNSDGPIGSSQAMDTPNKPLKQGPTSQPRVLRARTDGVPVERKDKATREARAERGAKQNKDSANKSAKSNEFAFWFPTLNQTITDLAQLTGFEDFKLSLKFASDEELSVGTRQFYMTKMQPIVQTVDQELISVLGDPWLFQKAQSNGNFAIHTILTLWRATLIPAFAELDASGQNALKWACLLQNISKRGTPLIHGRDHCHAFRSAQQALKVFQQLGLCPSWETEEQKEQWSQIDRLLTESVKPLPAIWREDFRHGKPVVTVMNSHHNLDEIFWYLWDQNLAPRGSFVDFVFRLVLFQKSIEALSTHPNMANLSASDRARYTDESLLKVIQLQIIADNESYIMFDESHLLRCRREIMTCFSGLASEARVATGDVARDTSANSSDGDSHRGKLTPSDLKLSD